MVGVKVMGKAILIMILSSLTIIGLYDIFKSIKSLILKPKKSNFSIILPIKDSDEDVEYKIRCLSNLIDIKDCHSNLIIADMGMDFKTLQTCHAASKHDDKIIICNPQEIRYFACDATNYTENII